MDREPRRSNELMHGLVLAAAFVVAGYSLALTSGLVAGAVGTIVGAQFAARLVKARYRTWVICALGAGIALTGLLATSLWLASQAVAAFTSPVASMQLAEVLRWGTVTWGLSIVLRALALRLRAALAIEGSLVVVAVVTTVAAHRDGMIARPLEISDWFWRQGIDPVLAFLGVGLAGAVLLAGTLAHGRSRGRTAVQLLFVLLLGVLLASHLHSRDSAAPVKNAVGQELNKKSDDKRDGRAGGASSEQRDRSERHDDLPDAGEGQRGRPAAIVVFHRDVRPAGGVFYFRHGAFTQFNGNRLIEPTTPGVAEELRHDFPIEVRRMPGPHEAGVGRVEVATDVALLTPHSRMFALTDATEVAPMPNPEPARFRRAYRVVSKVATQPFDELLGQHAGESSWSDERWEHYTDLPRDRRYHELAARLRGGIRTAYREDPVAMALTVKGYLEQSAVYSFKRKYEGASDPTAEFLFSEDMRGYCVHLAHAAAYLMRAMGLPARVSAGYAVPAENLAGGSALLLKTSDAHAWAELYMSGVGWIPIEVTPEQTDVEPAPFQEKDLQQLLGEMARKEGREEMAPYQGTKLKEILDLIAAAIPFVLLGLLALAYAVKAWRLSAPVFSPARAQPRLVYRAALDRVSASGFVRGRGEPRERFAHRLAELVPSFVPLTHVHVAAVLGSSAPLAAGGGRALSSLGSDLRRELGQSLPWWRRVWAMLNPISWLWSR